MSSVLIVTISVCSFVQCILSQSTGYQNSQTFDRAAGVRTENVADVENFLKEFNIEAAEMCNRVASNDWKYAANGSDYNKRRMIEQQSVAVKFECLSWRKAATYTNYRFVDTNLRRQLDRVVRQSKCGLSEMKFIEFNNIIAQMKTNYKEAKICPYQVRSLTVLHVDDRMDMLPANGPAYSSSNYCDLSIGNDLPRIMELSRNEAELRYIWSAWHDRVGPPNRNNFMRYIDLANQAAIAHGYRDAGDQMRASYEDSDMYFTVQDLWTQIQPLYRQIFTFVRKGLVRQYGEHIVRRNGPIPAHLLGNMWAQNWKNILDIVKERHTETLDVTGEMVKQGYTPTRIFQKAEEFFTSLGMPPMPAEFWRNSILQQTNGSTGKCTASAWDFCNNFDFRIKQCTDITVEDFIGSHQEMTHIQYFMHYSGQPFVYRDGPNPAFHEAIAHAIGLSAGGPVHLQRIGLLATPIQTSNGNSVINIEYLLSMALEKIPFLAFSLALEKWRWNVFEKGVSSDMNAHWWEQQLRYLGVVPPTQRTQDDFDAGAKFHVISDKDYIKHFVATILQFQIYSELCQSINHSGPLHTCDVYRSREVGRVLSEIMQHGASLSTSQLLKILTKGNKSRLSADALLSFFQPLKAWLEQQNRGEVIGWNSNIDDISLFKPLINRSAFSAKLSTIFLLFPFYFLSFSHHSIS